MGLLGGLSCSVFPDEATLQPGVGAGAAGAPLGGGPVLPTGGFSGASVEPSPAGGAGASDGGSFTTGGAGAASLGAGGASDVVGGSGAGGAACAELRHQVVPVTDDTWIEAAKSGASHGDDPVLSVIGGGQERRALLRVTLPAALAGATLVQASVMLQLEANADADLLERRLRLYRLDQEFVEGRATWNNWSNGSNRKWLTPGGDFSSAVGQATLSAGTLEDAVVFDVTAAIRGALGTSPVPLSLILLETTAPPPAPAELAFTSREGDASKIPQLLLEYCEP